MWNYFLCKASLNKRKSGTRRFKLFSCRSRLCVTSQHVSARLFSLVSFECLCAFPTPCWWLGWRIIFRRYKCLLVGGLSLADPFCWRHNRKPIHANCFQRLLFLGRNSRVRRDWQRLLEVETPFGSFILEDSLLIFLQFSEQALDFCAWLSVIYFLVLFTHHRNFYF